MRSNIAAALLFLVSTAAHSQSDPIFTIHGAHKTCAALLELDRALTTQDFSYFGGWTFTDFNVAVTWTAVCDFDNPVGSATRTDRIRAMETRMFGSIVPPTGPVPKDSEAAAARARADAALLAQQAEESKREAREESIARCHRTDAYRLYAAQNRILEDQDRKAKVLEAIEHEKKIEAVSGVQNLTRTYELGSAMVDVDERIHRDWIDYVGLGGSAASAGAATEALTNPCGG